MDAILKSAGIDASGLKLDDIDPSLYTPVSGLDAKQATMVNLAEGVNDMINIDMLDEQTVMKNLEIRYDRDIIYTYIGAILVAVNSFKKIPGLYDYPTAFQRKALSQVSPHIYALAEKAYAALVASNLNQAFIISGESGAGKTESMKLICRYMASVDTSTDSTVQHNILNVNVVLEAFGNAKTVYNNNSSRFGKFTELQFSQDNVLVGARVREYLLEKSRVVQQSKRERNYHVFYQLVAGIGGSERDQYVLHSTDPKHFHYLNQTGCTSIDGVDDGAMFAELKASMTMFRPDQVTAIFQVVAGVLHLGNVEFDMDASGENVKGISEATRPALVAAAKVLGIEAGALEKPLVTRTAFIRKEYITSPLNREKARDSRDALAKAVYGLLFNYIVRNINQSICIPKCDHFIGILDIFGFENFDHNSFEQLCINLANEQLQDFFNEFIFKLEQMEYKHEGLKLNEITFVDNKACLDMITEKTAGLLGILDEQSYFPKATTESLLQRQSQNFKGHANYEADRVPNKHSFGVKHYAGLVIYDASVFLEKNRDTIPSDLLQAAVSSNVRIIQELFSGKAAAEEAAETMKRKVSTVSNEFKLSLEELMTQLRKTQPYFIRCVKPNQQQVPNSFVEDFVLKQLRYSGMLETVRIRREGYPVRYTFDDFLNRFILMLPPADRKPIQTATTKKAATADLMKAIQMPLADYQVGKTKVFIRDKPAAILETRLAQIQAQRLALLKIEIEKKKKEEEERRKKEEEERKKREEEERKKREEQERIAAEQARIAAEKAAAEEDYHRRQREALQAKANLFDIKMNVPVGAENPPVYASDGSGALAAPPPPPAAALDKSGGGLRVVSKAAAMDRDLGHAAVAAAPAPPAPSLLEPPPPLPPGAMSRQQAEIKLTQSPTWMEEKELHKLIELHKKWEAYQVLMLQQAQVSRRAEDEISSLPPWKQELMRKRNAERAAASSAPQSFASVATQQLSRPSTPSSPRRSSVLVTPVAADEPQPRVATIGGTVMKSGLLDQLSTGASRLTSDARVSGRTESVFYADSPFAASSPSSPSPSPSPSSPAPSAAAAAAEEAPPVIPPGTMSRADAEARLRGSPAPTWTEEKELKRIVQLHKDYEKWANREKTALEAEQRKKAAEDARLAALPPWKRQQIEKKNAEIEAAKQAEVDKLRAAEAASIQAAQLAQEQYMQSFMQQKQAPMPGQQGFSGGYGGPPGPGTEIYAPVPVPVPQQMGGYAPPPPPPATNYGQPPPAPQQQPQSIPRASSVPPPAAPVASSPPAASPFADSKARSNSVGPAPSSAKSSPAGKGAAAAATAAPAPASAPAAAAAGGQSGDWKAALLDRKRKEAEDKARLEAEKKAAELNKLPLWKRAIMEKQGTVPA